MAAKIDTKLTGSAGEHYVCSMLARYGWAASLTRDGLERTDVLAVHSTERHMIEVQVKAVRTGQLDARTQGHPSRSVGPGVARLREARRASGTARVVRIPRDHVAAATWIGHQAWLTDPAVPKGKRNTPLEMARIGAEVWSGYEDGWDQLGLDTRVVPVRLPGWMRRAMDLERVGLPPDHPWQDRAALPEWAE